jgi:hypothetical protein
VRKGDWMEVKAFSRSVAYCAEPMPPQKFHKITNEEGMKREIINRLIDEAKMMNIKSRIEIELRDWRTRLELKILLAIDDDS